MKRAGVNVTSPLSTLTSTPVENTTQLEERIIEQDRLQFVRNLIDQLPEKQRSCMQLRDVEEKSYKEIAQILNISEEQVKVNIFRARQSIKQKFKEADEYGL